MWPNALNKESPPTWIAPPPGTIAIANSPLLQNAPPPRVWTRHSDATGDVWFTCGAETVWTLPEGDTFVAGASATQ